jgi:sugar/nucleoside kinase (ribokinase family)
MGPLRLPYPVMVGGHICLDIIPTLYERQAGMEAFLVPGKLTDIGPAVLATGGAVSNTGLALNRLGMPVRLMGKVGDDRFGEAILDLLRSVGPKLAEEMIVTKGETSSYTVVINPPGVDRIFLHCTGANDTFDANDLKEEVLHQAGLFHFGYPPLMRRMYEDEGVTLAAMLARVKAAGATTSLDLAKPDPDSPAGKADWRLILSRALPHVDLFLPSFEEILFMLRRDLYDDLQHRHGSGDMLPFADSHILGELADELLSMGAAVVVLKLGEYGLYMKSSSHPDRIASTGRYRPITVPDWVRRELYVPCFDVRVAGTTGAGDCTIAGFLAGWVQQQPPESALISAVATGACNVERPDATSGVRAWTELQERIGSGWAQREPRLPFNRFVTDGVAVWSGPADCKRM